MIASEFEVLASLARAGVPIDVKEQALTHSPLITGRCKWWKSRQFDDAPITSGLDRTTDIVRPAWHVSNVPNADIAGDMASESPAHSCWV